MTGAHRGPRVTLAELRARLTCWFYGHDIRQTGVRAWCCVRCERVASTPVELP